MSFAFKHLDAIYFNSILNINTAVYSIGKSYSFLYYYLQQYTKLERFETVLVSAHSKQKRA